MKRQLKLNSITSVITTLFTILNGLIVPKLILESYGSDMNGLTQSVTHFLSFANILDIGIASVAATALYKPLVNKDYAAISSVVAFSNKYFNLIAKLMAIYVLVLMMLSRIIISDKYPVTLLWALIAVIGMTVITQGVLGTAYKIVFISAQMGYVVNLLSMIAIFANTVFSVVFIKSGVSIIAVKAVPFTVYFIYYITIRKAAVKKYKLDHNVFCSDNPVKQKKNAVVQHIASVILNETDVMVLTMFSSLQNVSIYTVYNFVAGSLRTFIEGFFSGFQPLFGELLAKNDKDGLVKVFKQYEWILHFVAVNIFGSASVLITPFVMLYTKKTEDISYYHPVFGMFIVLASALICLRLPYTGLAFAAGKYKETQMLFITPMAVNVILSVIAVRKYNLWGIAAATCVAVVLQTVVLAGYAYKKILEMKFSTIFKQLAADFLIIAGAYIALNRWGMQADSWGELLICGIRCVAVYFVLSIAVHLILFRSKLYFLFREVTGIFGKLYI